MKILRIIARLNVGGPARHVLWLTESINDSFHSTELVVGTVPEGEDDMAYFAEQLGIRPTYLPQLTREITFNDVVALWKLYLEMCRKQPDIVHTHTAKAGTLGRIAAILYRRLTIGALIGRPRQVKIVHTFHGHVFHSYYGRLGSSIFLFIERLLARFATDRIVVISRRQFEEIHGKFRVGRKEQFEIIPLGIDFRILRSEPGYREAIRKRTGAKLNDIVVGFVGRLTEIKNVSLLLRVAAEQMGNAEESQTTRFLIAGDGQLRRSLEQQADELGISDIVTFVGNVENPAEVYAGVDIVALPSRNEGTPLSLIEAMAMGLPVIATAVGGVPDLLGDVVETHTGFSACERGVLAESGDVNGFLHGLSFLRENEMFRDQIAKSGKEYVHTHYSKERLVSDIVSLYEKLLGQRHL